MPREPRPSPLVVAVLGLLSGGPLHPYRMQTLLKQWGKDQVINVGQRSTLYKTIARLHDSGLIEIVQTERAEQYPERTVYAITEEGRRRVLAWLTEMIAGYRNEFPAFPAALSFAMMLAPDGLRAALTQRRLTLTDAVGALRSELDGAPSDLPRVALIETEYQLAMAEAELAWVEQTIAELASGALRWSYADFASAAEAYEID